MTPGRLEVDSATGRITGPAKITYNDPFPTKNGNPGYGAKTMMGLVVHTEVGNDPGTQAWFNNPASAASAFFAVGQDGSIIQFGPVGKDWMAWAQVAGNPMWYSVEDADNGHPPTPFTDAQVAGIAQLAEVLSRFAGFPLAVTDSVSTKGIGVHSMGGAAWGGHYDCPGDVRKAQRPAIVALAKKIRAGGTVTPPAAPRAKAHTTAGLGNLAELAAANNCTPAAILQATAEQGPYPADITQWLDNIFSGAASAVTPMAPGLKLYIPA